VVSATYYYADGDDTEQLLRYVDQSGPVEFRRWFGYQEGPTGILTREGAKAADRVAISSAAMGSPVLIREENDPALSPTSRAGFFNWRNFQQRPSPDQVLIDPNRSPLLYWEPSSVGPGGLKPGSIGSQADSPSAVSRDYQLWLNRIAWWIRRRGTRVWGLERDQTRPDLDIRNPFLNSIYALPGALSLLEDGEVGL